MNPDKKDLIINSLMNQRNHAMNAICDYESELEFYKSKNFELEEKIKELTQNNEDKKNESL